MTPRGRPFHTLTVLAVLALASCSSGGGGSGTAVLDTSPGVATPDASTTSVEAPASAVATTTEPPATSTSTSSGNSKAASTTTSTTPSTTSTIVEPGSDGFPGEQWATAELSAGVDRAALDDAVDTAFGAPDNQARVRSIVAVQGGSIVYERYHPLDGPDTIMESYSVAKSFTSATIGLLVGDGLLTVEQRAPVEAWADPDDPRSAITIEHLLHMASGLKWTEEYGPGSQPREMLDADVASDYVAALPLEAAPGEQFEYSTGTTAVLAGIITDTLGGVDATDAYLQERLLGPLGITSTRLLRDRSGRWLGGIGADSTSRDFARFGLLFLNDGVWDGTRILPDGWVDYSHTPSPTNAAYGAQWWMLRPDAFEARGLFGQIVMVSQVHDLVIVITTAPGGDADSLLEAAYAAFTER